jgi:hypothetical protein
MNQLKIEKAKAQSNLAIKLEENANKQDISINDDEMQPILNNSE